MSAVVIPFPVRRKRFRIAVVAAMDDRGALWDVSIYESELRAGAPSGHMRRVATDLFYRDAIIAAEKLADEVVIWEPAL